jgi:hypothetical protein
LIQQIEIVSCEEKRRIENIEKKIKGIQKRKREVQRVLGKSSFQIEEKIKEIQEI